MKQAGVAGSRSDRGEVFRFAGGSAVSLNGDEIRQCHEWREAFAQCAKDYRYYNIIEATLANSFRYRYLVLRGEDGSIVGIQPYLIVQQNLVEGIPGAIRQAIDRIRTRFPRLLTMRVLMLGCAAGEGHLSSSNHQERLAAALFEALPAVARSEGASLIVWKDFSARYRQVLGDFARHAFTRVPSMPMTRLQLDFVDFDDYLGHLSYGTRKSLRRKFRKTERSHNLNMEVTSDLTPYLDEVYPLYRAVQDRSSMKFENLTKEYFAQLGRLMPDRVRYFLWRLEGRIVAFSATLVHGDVIYDDYLGLDYSVALDLHLYFYTFRDIVSWAIGQGLKWYLSSPLNYDPKLHLGCALAPLDLYVRHTSPLLNPVFGRLVKLLEPTRHDPVLPRFPNAAELIS
ncbi:MAG: GNAT family N-acetyltransferase [Verrucomicrobiota bacterium]